MIRLEPFQLVLASGSPRRAELLKLMDMNFKIRVLAVEENYPDEISPEQVPAYLARKKANAQDLKDPLEICIAADTLVLLDQKILSKPENLDEAKQFLGELSGKVHEVITGVCILHQDLEMSFSETSQVEFGRIQDSEINYYVQEYKPLDKAGAYGVQDWIGLIGVKSIRGSYTNVMGLPTETLYRKLVEFRARL